MMAFFGSKKRVQLDYDQESFIRANVAQPSHQPRGVVDWRLRCMSGEAVIQRVNFLCSARVSFFVFHGLICCALRHLTMDKTECNPAHPRTTAFYSVSPCHLFSDSSWALHESAILPGRVVIAPGCQHFGPKVFEECCFLTQIGVMEWRDNMHSAVRF